MPVLHLHRLRQQKTRVSGWLDKPFALVTVNVDKNAEDRPAPEAWDGVADLMP